MSYYILPSTNSSININNISIQEGENNIVISKSLCYYLNMMKKQIDNYNLNWDIYKKYTNPYEYIHSIIPSTKFSISKLKPISRSFYKLIEITSLLHLLDDCPNNIKSFHLAEGPGGFIEAIQMLRYNDKDIYYGMTLIDDENDIIPGWKKSYSHLSKFNNIIIESGVDNKGDLFNVKNLLYCHDRYKSSMNLITGDGGFDFSIDFNKQETIANKLIFCQVCFAIAMQSLDGNFILKIFDIFTEITLDIIYLLTLLYKKVYIVKPNSSRYANSERYIVCKKFKLENSTKLVERMSELYPTLNSNDSIKRFLNIKIPYILINKIEDINAIIGQQQLECILSTFYLIDNPKQDKLEQIKKNNIQKCIQWCIKYKIPYNKNLYYLNSFLQL